jgi:hypothetical protein
MRWKPPGAERTQFSAQFRHFVRSSDGKWLAAYPEREAVVHEQGQTAVVLPHCDPQLESAGVCGECTRSWSLTVHTACAGPSSIHVQCNPSGDKKWLELNMWGLVSRREKPAPDGNTDPLHRVGCTFPVTTWPCTLLFTVDVMGLRIAVSDGDCFSFPTHADTRALWRVRMRHSRLRVAFRGAESFHRVLSFDPTESWDRIKASAVAPAVAVQ